jgi:hypothetical protein
MGRNPLKGGSLSSARQIALRRGRASDLSACRCRQAHAAWGCGVLASRPAGHYLGSGAGSWDEQSGSLPRVTDQR